MQRWGKGPAKKGNAVNDAWITAVGKETSQYARPISFKKGALMVLVENSTLLYQLTLEKSEIIKKFNNGYAGKKRVREIRFRIGEARE